MLIQSKDLQDLAIVATDGPIGEVKDLYFDDEAWAIRYLVVDAGSWLSSRKVLISPIATGEPDWELKQLPVTLTQEQVRHSPDVDIEMPVTRQHESEHLDYYSYPYYWGGMGLWGHGMHPSMLLPGYEGYGSAESIRAEADAAQARSETHERDMDLHLRSCKAVVGYHIEAIDGEIGHVESFLVDDESWAIRYLVVQTGHWWDGHNVLVAPQWIKRVSWAENAVEIDLTRDALKLAPSYDPAVPLDREMEIAIFTHYGRLGYWPGAPALAK